MTINPRAYVHIRLSTNEDGYASHVSTPFERFMTRLLRRQLFEALADVPQATNEPYPLHMFGSAVLQRYRPAEGYPILRLARDLDLGVTFKDRYKEIPNSEKTYIGKKILTAMKQVDAEIVPGTLAGVPGFDGFTIPKTFTLKEVGQYLKTKCELQDVTLPEMPEDTPIKVELNISPIFMRSPALPLESLGRKGFSHEDVREVLGMKLRRMLSPPAKPGQQSDFEIRDVMDFYNAIASGRINPEYDAEMMRVIGLVSIAAHNNEKLDYSYAHLEPTEENVKRAAKAMGITDLKFMHNVFETVHEAIQTIFSKERSDLPDKMAGQLGFTLNEYNFLSALEGIEHLPSGRGVGKIQPKVNAKLIVDDNLEHRCQGLRSRINNNWELLKIVGKARAQRSIGDH